MEKSLKKIDKMWESTQKKETRYCFNGAYYPKNFPTSRVLTNGRYMLVDNRKNLLHGLYGTDSINHCSADLIESVNLIDDKFPEITNVIPSKFEKVYEVEIPNWIGQIKQGESSFLGIDLETGFFSSDPKNVQLNLGYLAPFAGVTVYLGFNDSKSPLALWGAGKTYNPFLNEWTWIFMPVKAYNIKPISKEIEIKVGELEVV
jgi:hypothetical protein